MQPKSLRYLFPVVGFLFVASLLVLISTDLYPHLPQKLGLLVLFGIGPIAVAGMLGIGAQLARSDGSFRTQVGTVMLVIAFSCFTMMLVVQQLGRLRYLELRSGASIQEQEMMRLAFSSLNWVQLGMDFTFDIFFGIGVLLFSVAMYRDQNFGKFVGVTGVLMATYLLLSNMWSFPATPKEAGVPDPAAAALAWWLLVIVVDNVKRKRLSKQSPPDGALPE